MPTDDDLQSFFMHRLRDDAENPSSEFGNFLKKIWFLTNLFI